jgi:hypothetical protein
VASPKGDVGASPKYGICDTAGTFRTLCPKPHPNPLNLTLTPSSLQIPCLQRMLARNYALVFLEHHQLTQYG